MRMVCVSVTLCLVLHSSVLSQTLRISCVGNSITHWSGYTDMLQSRLGGGYEVHNAGRYGTTLQKSADLPYWTCEAMRMVFVNQPDLITIFLGTNDTKSYNWDAQNYERDLNAMVDTFWTMPSSPRVWLCHPTPSWSNTHFVVPSIIEQEIRPIITRVAQQRGLPVIDLFTPLAGRQDLFEDGVHPSAEAAGMIADIMYSAFTTSPAMHLSKRSLLFRSYLNGASQPPALDVTVRNMGVGTTLQQVTATKSASWLSVSIDAASANAQVITTSVDPSQVPSQEQTYVDTVTITCGNAVPSSVEYAVALWVRDAPVLWSVDALPSSVSVAYGDTAQLSMQAYDQYDDTMTTSESVSWSATGGSISGSGVYVAGSTEGAYQAMVTCGSFTDTTHINVTQLPLLAPGYIKRMLVLTKDGSPYIPKSGGSFDTDYLGGEIPAMPQQGDTVLVLGQTCVWQPMTDDDGFWFDDETKDDFVAYGALYIVCDTARELQGRFRIDDACRIILNQSTRATRNTNDDGAEAGTNALRLKEGVNRFLFKMIDNIGDSYFALRIVDSSGNEVDDLFYTFDKNASGASGLAPSAAWSNRQPSVAGGSRVKVSFLEPGLNRVVVYDTRGRVVDIRSITGTLCIIPTQPLGRGVYLVEAIGPDCRTTRSVVVK